MSEGFDLYAIFLAVAVAALFGGWFWQVSREMRFYFAGLWRFLDSRAARQRAELEREAMFGPPSSLRRVAQGVMLAGLAACCALLLAHKFELI